MKTYINPFLTLALMVNSQKINPSLLGFYCKFQENERPRIQKDFDSFTHIASLYDSKTLDTRFLFCKYWAGRY